MSDAVVEINNLSICFSSKAQTHRAVDGISLSIPAGKTLGLVGESGSGKSLTALSIMNLLPANGVTITADRMRFKSCDLLKLKAPEWRALRGHDISMIFQEPMTSLNPLFTVGDQIAEVYRTHKNCSASDAKMHALQMLDRVKIPDAKRRFNEFPHQLSGGMRQRIMIAIAIACDPQLLIADEPTTALDVTIQAQIMNLIYDLQVESKMAILLITHDLAMVAQTCDRVAVMYGGKIVEQATTSTLFENPSHPYTQALLHARPHAKIKRGSLPTIPGQVPAAGQFPRGCRYSNRCAQVMSHCSSVVPESTTLKADSSHHVVACHLYGAAKT